MVSGLSEAVLPKAVILAAGVGKRLGEPGPGQHKMPKAMLNFDGKTLLARHIGILRGLGISDISVVIGFAAGEMREALSALDQGPPISIVFNPDYRDGSVVSLWAARAVLRSGTSQSAFPQREAPFMVTVSGSWDDPGLDQDGVAWAREAIDSVRAWKHPGAYSNYISHQESPQQASAMYGSAIYSRLAQVKQAYDPDNMFRSARNIIPASTQEPHTTQ